MIRRLGALLLGLGLALLLAEGLVRAVGLDGTWLRDLAFHNVADPGVHQASDDPELLYTLRPGARGDFPPLNDPDAPRRTVTINQLGHRGVERSVDKAPGAVRILALGGSNTYGAAVGDGDTWPEQLERALQARGVAAEVWNLGVSGYEARQKAAQARHALAWDPDLLIVQLHNVGPRYLVPDDDPLRWIGVAPDLVREWMPGLPDGGPSAWAFRTSALARLVLMLPERRARADDPEGGVPLAPFEARGRAALRSLLTDLPPDVQAMGFVPPPLFAPGAPDNALPDHADTGLPLLVLDGEERPGADPLPDLRGLRDIHPPAAVYALYAERLADALVGERCATRGFRGESLCLRR